MLIAMRVQMRGGVTVRVYVHAVGVVVVSRSVRVLNVSVILISRICVVAMPAVRMI